LRRVLYYKGEGVTRDYAEAAKWYRKAANQGDADAQTILGSMYGEGKGVPRDYVWAYMWYSLAAAQSEKARSLLNLLEGMMTPDQIAEAQKRASAWKPQTN
jgi:TPR repeat protein